MTKSANFHAISSNSISGNLTKCSSVDADKISGKYLECYDSSNKFTKGRPGQILVSGGPESNMYWGDSKSTSCDLDFLTGYSSEIADITEIGKEYAYKGFAVAISFDGSTRASLDEVTDTIDVVKDEKTYSISWTMSSGPPTTIKLNSDGTIIAWGGSFEYSGQTVYYSTWDTSTSTWRTPTGLDLSNMAGPDTRILTLDMTTAGDTLVVTWGDNYGNAPYEEVGFGFSLYKLSELSYIYRVSKRDITGYGFGQSIAISDSVDAKNYIVVGEPYFSVSTFTNIGKIYIYSYDLDTHVISLLKELYGNSDFDTTDYGLAQDRYVGWDLDISSDAKCIAICCPGSLRGGEFMDYPNSESVEKSGFFILKKNNVAWGNYNKLVDLSQIQYADPALIGRESSLFKYAALHSVKLSADGSNLITQHPWWGNEFGAYGTIIAWYYSEIKQKYIILSYTTIVTESEDSHAWHGGHVWATGPGSGRGLDFNGKILIVGSATIGKNTKNGAVKLYHPISSDSVQPYNGIVDQNTKIFVCNGLIYGFIN